MFSPCRGTDQKQGKGPEIEEVGGGLLELQIPAGEQELPLTHCLNSALYQDANDPYEDYQRLIYYSYLVSSGSSNFLKGSIACFADRGS